MAIKISILVGALVFGLTGCAGESSNGASADDQETVSALSEALQVQQGRIQSLPPLGATQADCVASGLVDVTGTDALVKYGILNSDLSINTSSAPLAIPTETATQMVTVMMGCVDLVELQLEGLGDEPADVASCYKKVLNEAGVRKLLLSALTGDKSTLKEMNQALQGCIVTG